MVFEMILELVGIVVTVISIIVTIINIRQAEKFESKLSNFDWYAC